MYNLIPDTLLNPLSPLPNFLQKEEGKNSTKIFSSPQIDLCVFFHRIERSFNERLKYSNIPCSRSDMDFNETET